jgi:uroporphyrinogen decarboxylase
VTGRERFVTALKGGMPDRVPVFDFLDSSLFLQRVLGRKVESYQARDVMEATFLCGLDGAFIGYGGFAGYGTTEESPLGANRYRDEWGTVWEKNGYSWPSDAPVDHPLKEREDLRRYRMPDPELPSRMDEIALAQEMSGGRVAVIGGIQGPLTTAIFLCGLTNLFTKAADDPGFVTDVFRLSNEYFSVAVRRMIEAHVDVICVPEDLGFASGPFLSVDMFRRLLLPRIVELFAPAVAAGVPTFLHCDGGIQLYLDDLMSVGFDGLHPIQRTAGMTVRGVRERCGGKLCLVGNVDSSHTLVHGSEERVVWETLETIRDGGLGGALILASDSDIRNEMPYEKVDLMFKTARRFGAYPIDVAALEAEMERCAARGAIPSAERASVRHPQGGAA